MLTWELICNSTMGNPVAASLTIAIVVYIYCAFMTLFDAFIEIRFRHPWDSWLYMIGKLILGLFMTCHSMYIYTSIVMGG